MVLDANGILNRFYEYNKSKVPKNETKNQSKVQNACTMSSQQTTNQSLSYYFTSSFSDAVLPSEVRFTV